MRGLRTLPMLIVAATIAATTFSCREERHSFVPGIDDPAHTPTMSTFDVATLISDSGYTKYKIVAPLWEIYDDAEEPFWRFPTGLDLQQYDSQLKPAASIVCDSAVYFSRLRLWRLDGHVVMVNTERDSFITAQLFWDQFHKEIRSDSFIHIVRSDRIIEGYGFRSDQNMTSYNVNRPTGIIPIERQLGQKTDTTAASDSATADTIDLKPAMRRRPAPKRASQRSLDAGDVPNNHRIQPVKTLPKH